MAIWTKLQRKYVRDIETMLGIIFAGNPTRKDADIFIKEHAEEHRKMKLDLNKQFPPTGKQQRLIKEIEERLDIKFTGRTVRTASAFIEKYLDEFKALETSKDRMKRFINYKAKNLKKESAPRWQV